MLSPTFSPRCIPTNTRRSRSARERGEGVTGALYPRETPPTHSPDYYENCLGAYRVANEYYNETFFDSHSSRHRSRSHRKRAQYEECCPTVLEMVEPIGGKNQDGMFVELYRDNNYRQRFYELSCTKEVLNKPCNLINKKKSKCVQRTSFTYALVKNTKDHRDKNLPVFPTRTGGEVAYTLDYIEVRSGCSCVVASAKRKRSGPTAAGAQRGRA